MKDDDAHPVAQRVDTHPDGAPKLVIMGAGAFAEEVADLATDAGFSVVAFIEGVDRAKSGRRLNEQPVIWIDDIGGFAHSAQAICAAGATSRADFIGRAAAAGLKFTALVHPRAQVSSTSRIGTGTLVSAGVVVAVKCRVGQHVILNRGCLIGHHVTVGDYATISPGAMVGGAARIGSRAFVGMGAIVLEKITIGDGAVVGAGAVVTRDVPNSVQVLGTPARIVKAIY